MGFIEVKDRDKFIMELVSNVTCYREVGISF